jgi:hypothetical protein
VAATITKPASRTARRILAAALKTTGLRTKFAAGTLTPSERRSILHAVVGIGKDRLKAEGQRLAKRLERAAASDGLGFSSLSAALFTSRRSAVTSWAARVGRYLRELFVAGSLALLGPANLTDVELASLSVSHANQVAYLDNFATDILDGSQPLDGTLPARAAMYGSAAWGIAQNTSDLAAVRLGFTSHRRILGSNENHCEDCVEEADKGWRPVGTLRPIGDSICGSRCDCHFIHRGEDVVVMSKLSKKQRDELPESDFGDSTRRLFPIVDQDDVDSAARLIGKARNPEAVKARIVAIARRKGLKIPDAWKAGAKMSDGNRSPDTLGDIATFNLDAGGRFEQGGYAVYPNAALFKCGEYPAKRFGMTPEEAWAAVESFAGPVGGDIEHTHFLHGRACEIRAVRLDEADPEWIRAEIAVPLWLDRNLAEHEKKLSAVFNRDKQITGVSLTAIPHVKEAALIAAFAEVYPDDPEVVEFKERTYQGQRLLQTLHDTAAGAGAVCMKGKDGKDAKGGTSFHASGELAAIQKVHDETIRGGAACGPWMNDGSDPDSGSVSGSAPMFSTRKHHPTLTEGMQRVHDIIGLYPGGCVAKSAGAVFAFADTTEQYKAIKTIHGLTTQHGAKCPVKMSEVEEGAAEVPSDAPGRTSNPTPVPVLSPKRGKSMAKTWEDFVAFFTGSKPDDAANGNAETTMAETPAISAPAPKPATRPAARQPAEPVTQPATEFSDPKAAQRIRELEERLELARKDRIKSNVTDFAEDMVASSIVPAKLRPDLENLLIQFSEDDHATPAAITFSSGGPIPGETKTGDRVAAVMAFIAKLPKSHLVGEYVDGSARLKEGFTALFNEVAPHDPNAPPTEKRTKELLSKTALGAKVVQGNQGNGSHV